MNLRKWGMEGYRIYLLKWGRYQLGKFFKKGFFNWELFTNIAVRFSQVINRL